MAKKRKELTKRTRFEVFKRDRFKCQYCGRTPPAVILQVDHVIAVANGGGNESSNLVTSCEDCNSGKSDKPLDSAIPSIQDNIARQQELLEQVKAFNRVARALARQTTISVQSVRNAWDESMQDAYSRMRWGGGNDRSVANFIKQLGLDAVLSAVDIAMSRKSPRGCVQEEETWKYFCGICWKGIRGGNE